MPLTAIPNVSAPSLPCLPTQTAVHDATTGQWLCYTDPIVCPAGTTLYVAPASPFPWKFCTPDAAYAAATYGPNVAAQTVPTLSEWGVIVLVVLLGIVGCRRV